MSKHLLTLAVSMKLDNELVYRLCLGRDLAQDDHGTCKSCIADRMCILLLSLTEGGEMGLDLEWDEEGFFVGQEAVIVVCVVSGHCDLTLLSFVEWLSGSVCLCRLLLWFDSYAQWRQSRNVSAGWQLMQGTACNWFAAQAPYNHAISYGEDLECL